MARFEGNPPAAEASLRAFEDAAFQLPDDYKRFLRRTNGGVGFVGNAYVDLWPIERLRELNDAYEVGQYARGLFFFGSDGGGEAFAFDRRSATLPIVSVPFVGLELEQARPMGASFEEFLEQLSRS
jgi:hypothetical protein